MSNHPDSKCLYKHAFGLISETMIQGNEYIAAEIFENKLNIVAHAVKCDEKREGEHREDWNGILIQSTIIKYNRSTQAT